MAEGKQAHQFYVSNVNNRNHDSVCTVLPSSKLPDKWSTAWSMHIIHIYPVRHIFFAELPVMGERAPRSENFDWRLA